MNERFCASDVPVMIMPSEQHLCSMQAEYIELRGPMYLCTLYLTHSDGNTVTCVWSSLNTIQNRPTHPIYKKTWYLAEANARMYISTL